MRYRDALGRERMEHRQHVSIMDCVARAFYWLDADKKVAYRQDLEVFVDPWPEKNPPETIVELGSRLIHGLVMEGRRKIWTSPERSTSELWVLPQLGGMVIQSTFTRTDSVIETDIENLSLEEPPSELFQVPPDYTIKDAPDASR